MNERATNFRDFCVFMLGTTDRTPLMVGETPVNGATISAILDAFKTCYPDERPPKLPSAKPDETRDPLGMHA